MAAPNLARSWLAAARLTSRRTCSQGPGGTGRTRVCRNLAPALGRSVLVAGAGLLRSPPLTPHSTSRRRSRDARSEEARYVRVRADKLDDLINLVGELVIASAGTTIQARQANNSPLIESTLSMGRLIEEIRNGALVAAHGADRRDLRALQTGGGAMLPASWRRKYVLELSGCRNRTR